MQALFEISEELGEHPGLALLPGRVVRFPDFPDRKVPHTGWNRLEVRRRHPVLDGLPDDMRSSMQNDLAAGNRLEAPWLSGAVARMAAESGLPAPVSATLYAAMKPWVDGSRP